MSGDDGLAEIRRNLFPRFARVLKTGIKLEEDDMPKEEIEIVITGYTPARTLYVEHKPECKSLDGVESTKGNRCAGCPDRAACTAQVLVKFHHNGVPYQLLVAFTSARNFLLYHDRLKRAGEELVDKPTVLRIRNRRWGGEVVFEKGTN